VRVLIAHASSKARDALTDVVTRGADEYLEIVTASDGADTLDLLLREDPPEVALVDWDLPGIEGPEMCRLVRDFHHGHDTHLVVLAASRHVDTADAWRAGAADCVSTPASAETLWAAVEKGLAEMSAPQPHADVWDPESCDQGTEPDVWGSEPHDLGAGDEDESPAELDAVRAGDGAADFFGFGASELGATAEHDVESRETERPRGAVLLQAVIGEF
jgi:DNA-binding response OmpR family regulator